MNLLKNCQWARAFVLMGAYALAACSGGVGGVAEPASPSTAGVLSKGPITGATCTLYSAARLTVLATASTTAGGVNFGSLSALGPVYATCTGGTYTDEATGATVNNTVTMSSAGVIVEGQSLTLAITPLTTMAWNMSAGDPTKMAENAATVAKAFGLTGVDIVATTPTDLNTQAAADDAAGKYGTVLAAIAQMQKNQGASLGSTLATLGNAVNTNGTMSTTVSNLLAAALADLTNATKNSNTKVQTNATTTVKTVGSTITAAAGTGTGTNAGAPFGSSIVFSTQWVSDNSGLTSVMASPYSVMACGDGFVALGRGSAYVPLGALPQVISDSNQQIATSSDGVIWKAPTLSPALPSNAYLPMAKGNAGGSYCAQNTLIFSSYDSTTSSTNYLAVNVVSGVVTNITSSIKAALPTGATGFSLYNSLQTGNFYAIYADGTANAAAKSADGGITWTAITNFPATGYFQLVSTSTAQEIWSVWNPSATSPSYSLSYDGGATWSATNMSAVMTPTMGMPSIHKTASGYVAINSYLSTPTASTSNVATSSDGITWTALTTTVLTPTNYNYLNGVYGSVGNTLLLYVYKEGLNGYYVSADNGNTLTTVTFPTELGSNVRVYVVNGQFVATANASVSPYYEIAYTSTDGITWTALSTTPALNTISPPAQYACPYMNATQVVSNKSGSIGFIFNNFMSYYACND